mgnify:CR=1 FL=1
MNLTIEQIAGFCKGKILGDARKGNVTNITLDSSSDETVIIMYENSLSLGHIQTLLEPYQWCRPYKEYKLSF